MTIVIVTIVFTQSALLQGTGCLFHFCCFLLFPSSECEWSPIPSWPKPFLQLLGSDKCSLAHLSRPLLKSAFLWILVLKQTDVKKTEQLQSCIYKSIYFHNIITDLIWKKMIKYQCFTENSNILCWLKANNMKAATMNSVLLVNDKANLVYILTTAK